MEYNKQQFTKTKDKKVLHKVKKQWVVVSLAMLAMLGGGVMAKKVSAHADVNSDNNANNGAVTLKDRLNQSLSQAHKATLQTPANSNNRQNDQNNANASNSQRNINVNQISQQANVLHKRIIRNANFANADQSTAAVHSENGRNDQWQAQTSNQKITGSTNGAQKEVVNAPQVGSSFQDPNSVPYTDFNNMNLNNINPSTPRFQKVVNEWNSDFEKVDTSKGVNDLKTLIGQAVSADVLTPVKTKTNDPSSYYGVSQGNGHLYFYSDYASTSRIDDNISNPNHRMGNVLIYEGGLLPTDHNGVLPNISSNDGWHVYFDVKRPTYPASNDIAANSDAPDPVPGHSNDSSHAGDALISYGVQATPSTYNHVLQYTSDDIKRGNYGFTPFIDSNGNLINPLTSYDTTLIPFTTNDEMNIQKYLPNEYENLEDEFKQYGHSPAGFGFPINEGSTNSDFTKYLCRLTRSDSPTPHTAFNNADNHPDGTYYKPPFNNNSVKSANLAGLNISYMYGLFQNDHQLQSLDMRGFNGSDVLNMNAMLSGCTNLNYLNLQGLDLTRVRDMRDVFLGDSSLKALNLAHVLTSPYVFSFNNTFKSDKALKSVNLSGIETVQFKPGQSRKEEKSDIKTFLKNQIKIQQEIQSDVQNGMSYSDAINNADHEYPINLNNIGISHMVSDMSDLFSDDPNIQRLRLSSDTIFVSATGNEKPNANWGLFGTSLMVADLGGYKLNESGLSLMRQYQQDDLSDHPSDLFKDAIFNLIYPANDSDARVSNVTHNPSDEHDYEYFAASPLNLDFNINSDSDNYSALIPTNHEFENAIDGKGHLPINGYNYYGKASDGFVDYQGSRNAFANYPGVIMTPQTKDQNGQAINRPNGYSDSPIQSIEGGNSHYDVTNNGIIDNLTGKPESYKVYLCDPDISNNPLTAIVYDGSIGRPKAIVGKNVTLPNSSQLNALGYNYSKNGFYTEAPGNKVMITTGLDGPNMLNGDPNNINELEDSDNPQHRSDNGELQEYTDYNAPTASSFKIPVFAYDETIPVQFYEPGHNDNQPLKSGSSQAIQMNFNGYTGNHITNMYQLVSNYMSAHLSSYKIANPYVENDLNNYKIGTALTADDLSGGGINASWQNPGQNQHYTSPIMVPVQTAENSLNIVYVNKLNTNQLKQGTSNFTYNGSYTGSNTKNTNGKTLSDFASNSDGLPSNYYVVPGQNYDKQDDTIYVNVLPHVYNIPVDLYYGSNKLTHITISAPVNSPYDYDQSLGTGITDKIKAYLSNPANNPGNEYTLTSSIQNILSQYKAGDANNFDKDGIQGGNLVNYNLTSNPASSGTVNTIKVPLSMANNSANIEYINASDLSQRKSGNSKFTYAGNYNQNTVNASDFDQPSQGMPAHFYIDLDYNNDNHTSFSDNNGTIDVYVRPYIREIPVKLVNNGSQVYGPGLINVTSGGPYQQQQQVGSDIYNYISNIYLPSKGSNYQLTSSDYNALQDYQAGININEAGISGISGGQENGKGNLNATDDNAYATVTQITLNVAPNHDTVQFVNELKGHHSRDPLWTWTSDTKSYWNRSSVNIHGDIPSEVQNDGVPNGYYIDPNNNNYKVSDNMIKVNVLPDQVQVPVKYANVDDNDSILKTSSNSNQDYVSHINFPTENLDRTGANNNSELVANKVFDNDLSNSNNFSSHQNYATYPADRYQFSVYQNGDYDVNPNGDGLINNNSNESGYTLIPVAPQHIVAEGNWDLAKSGSAKFTISSDGSGNPHNDTLTFYGGPMDTNSWNNAGYNHGQGNVYVFDHTDNGSDEAPNALNRDSIRHIVFAKGTTLPTGSDGYTGLFKDMHYLSDVKFNGNAKIDTSKPTTLASMFSDDTSLRNLDLTGLDVSNVTDMSNMFAGDSILSDLTLSTVPTTNSLKDISGMFASDSTLSGTTFQDKDVDNDTSQGTNSIKNISDINTSNVSDMSDVFESDTNLSNLDLSSWKTDNVSDMDAMFANDPNLQHLNIQNMTTKGMYVGASDQMFQGDFSDSNNNYSDNPSQKNYAIVMGKDMRLTRGSGLIGYWASPDYADDPVMFSPRELDLYGANLGPWPSDNHPSSPTWIKQANNLNDLTTESFQYYNQMNSLVGSAKTTIPKNYSGTVSPYNFIKHGTPKGYTLPPSSGSNGNGGSLTDTLLNSNISNPVFTSFSNVDQRVNVLGDVEKSAMPINVTESGESNFGSNPKHVNIWGYYGDFKDSLDGEDLWYNNATNYNNGNGSGEGPDQYFSLGSSSNDYNHKMYYTLSSGNFSSGTNYTNKTNIQWQNNTQAPTANQNDQEPVLDYKNMVADNVKIQFIDQDGNTVHTDGPLSNVHIGQSIPLPTSTDDAYRNYGLPAGYQLDSGQPTSYKISNSSSTVDLYVSGDEETATAKVNIVYENSDGQNVSDITSDPVQLTGHVNDIVNFNPSTVVPKSGYQLDANKTNSVNSVDGSFPAKIDANNLSNWTKRYPNVTIQDGSHTSTITNDEPTIFFKDVEAVLTTVYIDQSGNVVGHPNTIEGTAGKSVNVTDPKENGEAIPQGYYLDGGDKTQNGHNADSDVIGNDQDTQYTMEPGHHTVYLHVNGDSDTDNAKVRVLCILHNRDHTTSVKSDSNYDLSDDTSNHQVHVGDVITVNPSDPIKKDTNLENDLKGYSIAPSDQSQPVTVNADGVSPNTVVFNYDQSNNPNKGESITYHFYDQGTNRELSSGVDNGSLGQSDDPVTKHGLPKGYQLADNTQSSNYNYYFASVPKDVWIPVVGTQVNDTFTIHQIKNNLDGSRTLSDIKVSVKADIGQTFHVSPYGFSYNGFNYNAPSGYHADPSDQGLDVQIKPDKTLSSSSVTYGYSQDYQPSAIGAVDIHYITGIPNGSHQEIDKVSDHGVVGDNFILRPYYDDLPDTVADSYQSTGKVFGQSGNQLDANLNGTVSGYSFSNGVTKFQSGNTPNIYIQVKKI